MSGGMTAASSGKTVVRSTQKPVFGARVGAKRSTSKRGGRGR
jgi:hypothetical protein